MRCNKIVSALLLTSSFLSSTLFAHGTGISTHPIEEKVGLLTTEFSNFVSDGKGTGIQARYTYKASPMLTLDGGIGFSNGPRKNRIFAGADLELFPDYGKQPRISLKGGIENAEEFNTRRNIFSVTPLMAKGFIVAGNPIFPYFGVPLGLSLDSGRQTYAVRSAAVFGFTTKLPIENVEKLLINVEGSVKIQNSYSGLFIGLSLPMM